MENNFEDTHDFCSENCCCDDPCADNCCCDDQDPLRVTLTLEDDTVLECNVIGTFDIDDNEYIAVVPIDGDEAFIYKYFQDENEQITLHSIESDEEFEIVSEVFYNLFEADFDEEDINPANLQED